MAALLLVTAPLSGCKKANLVELEVPASGVELRYDLQPGATFDGKILRRETLSSRGQQLNRSLSFTVQLVVRGLDEKGNALVAATIANIDIDWVVPGMPMSMDEFAQKSKQRLEGATIRFFVEPSGRVFDVPSAPPELSDPEAQVLDSVLEGLTSAFFVVPEDKLSAGGTWENSDTRGREGKLGKYIVETNRGALEGMFEDTEAKFSFAQLGIERDRTETTTTKDGSSEIRVRETTTVQFDTGANYLRSLESKMTRTQGPTVTTVRFQADWERGASSPVAADMGGGEAPPADAGTGDAAGNGDANVQRIDDPCSDDYVGPDDCLDPCSVNYMGEEACEKAEDGAGEAPAEGAPAEDAAAPAE